MSSIVDRAKSAIGSSTPTADEAGGRVTHVRETLLAFGDGDLGRFFGALSEDVEWVAPSGDDFPASGTIRGRDELRERLVADIKRGYASFGFRADHYLEADDRDWVVMIGTFTGELIQGRQNLDAPGVQVWEFDGDDVCRVRIFTDAATFPDLRTDEQVEEDHRREREQESGEDDDGEEPQGRSENGDRAQGASDDDERERDEDDSGED